MMRSRWALLPALAAASLLTAPASAGSPHHAASDGRSQMAEPDAASAPPRRSGPFTCSFAEQRTKLERKNCGGQRF